MDKPGSRDQLSGFWARRCDQPGWADRLMQQCPLNYQLRKIIKNRGHFQTDDAVIKLLWLAIRDIEDKRARARAKEKCVPATNARPPAGSSKEPASKAGNKPSEPSP